MCLYIMNPSFFRGCTKKIVLKFRALLWVMNLHRNCERIYPCLKGIASRSAWIRCTAYISAMPHMSQGHLLGERCAETMVWFNMKATYDADSDLWCKALVQTLTDNRCRSPKKCILKKTSFHACRVSAEIIPCEQKGRRQKSRTVDPSDSSIYKFIIR